MTYITTEFAFIYFQQSKVSFFHIFNKICINKHVLWLNIKKVFTLLMICTNKNDRIFCTVLSLNFQLDFTKIYLTYEYVNCAEVRIQFDEIMLPLPQSADENTTNNLDSNNISTKKEKSLDCCSVEETDCQLKKIKNLANVYNVFRIILRYKLRQVRIIQKEIYE